MAFPKKVNIPNKTNAISVTDINKQLSANEVNQMAQAINDNALFYGNGYASLSALQSEHANPVVGGWAYLGNGDKYEVKTAGTWVLIASDGTGGTFNGDEFVKKASLFEDVCVNLYSGRITTAIQLRNGVISKAAGNNYKSVVVKIEDGLTYTVKKYGGGDTFRLGTIDLIPTYSSLTQTAKYVFIDDNNAELEKIHTFTNTANAKYLFLMVTTQTGPTEMPLVQVEEGSIATEFQSYGCVPEINKELIPNKELKKEIKQKFANRDFRLDTYLSEGAEVFPNGTDTMFEEVYAFYDALVLAHPNYITKTVLGQDSLGNDINKYVFRPVEFVGLDGTMPFRKVAIISGQHGEEKFPVFADCNLMKTICEDWESSKILEYFRFNVEFHIIPVVNTSGFNISNRANVNGRNINRNFPDVATFDTTGLELETKCVVEFLEQNQDLEFTIDHHSGDRLAVIAFVFSINQDVSVVFAQTMMKLSSEWKKIYPDLNQDVDEHFSYVDGGGTLGGTLKYYLEILGIPGCTLEHRTVPLVSTDTKTGVEVDLMFKMDVTANLIINFL